MANSIDANDTNFNRTMKSPDYESLAGSIENGEISAINGSLTHVWPDDLTISFEIPDCVFVESSYAYNSDSNSQISDSDWDDCDQALPKLVISDRLGNQAYLLKDHTLPNNRLPAMDINSARIDDELNELIALHRLKEQADEAVSKHEVESKAMIDEFEHMTSNSSAAAAPGGGSNSS